MWHSRRGFIGLTLAVIFGPGRLKNGSAASAPSPQQPDPGTAAPGPPIRKTVQRYRADAVILLLGLPLYKRAGVGGGQVSIEETGEGPDVRRTLFFAAGSDAKRAHGFKRLGWIREVTVGAGPTPAEADYFGVLSSSPEESLEHARKTAETAPAGRSLYSAVNGRHTAGHSRSAVTHFEFSADAEWSDRRLIDEAQSTFQENVQWRETSWPDSRNHAPPTFLLQLANLLKQREKRSSGRYVYNEQEYLLELETSRPSSAAAQLLPIRGVIRNQRTGYQTPFRVWIENTPDSIVPVRIEFQPRSFLRLTFEALPA